MSIYRPTFRHDIESIVGDDVIDEKNNELPVSNLQIALKSGLAMAFWYFFSISISAYNKWMFSSDHLNFHFPLFTTCGHQIVQGILAYLAITQLSDFLAVSNRIDRLLNDQLYIDVVGPCALAYAGDIGLGNLAIQTVTLSFFTMVKSSSLIFVLMFGVLFGLERPSRRLIGVILFMSFGVMLMVAGESRFELFGSLLVLMSSASSGLRWSLTQILLKPNPAWLNHKKLALNSALYAKTQNPLETIVLLAPLMVSLLLLMAVSFEGLEPFLASEFWKINGIFGGIAMIAFPGMLAFFMTLSELFLLANTSVLTLSISGIFKEIITICVGLVFFNDTLSFTNSIGLIITLLTMGLYNIVKYQEKQSTH